MRFPTPALAAALLLAAGGWLAGCDSSGSGSGSGSGRATVVLGGDVHGEVGDDPLAGIADVLHAADIAVVNLETPVATRGAPEQGKAVTFRAEPDLATALADAGVAAVSLANNHALDYGPEALAETLALADEAGLAPIGAGTDAAHAAAPAVFDTPAGRVAIIGLSSVVPEGWAATGDRPGIASALDVEAATDAVRAATAEADHVIVTVHWGNEYRACPSVAETALADALAAAGADVIAGHHAHVLQGIDERDGTLTAFSLGNLAFAAATEETRSGALLEVTLDSEGVSAHRLLPVWLDEHGRPAPATATRAGAIQDTLAARSPGGGTCPAAVWDGSRR